MFPVDNLIGYEKLLLKLSPMNNESSQSAQAHFDFLKFLLFVYDRNLFDVVALVGDNTSTTRAFSMKLGHSFIGCHSHCFCLAVKDLIEEHRQVVENGQAIMRKLSY